MQTQGGDEQQKGKPAKHRLATCHSQLGKTVHTPRPFRVILQSKFITIATRFKYALQNPLHSASVGLEVEHRQSMSYPASRILMAVKPGISDGGAGLGWRQTLGIALLLGGTHAPPQKNPDPRSFEAGPQNVSAERSLRRSALSVLRTAGPAEKIPRRTRRETGSWKQVGELPDAWQETRTHRLRPPVLPFTCKGPPASPPPCIKGSRCCTGSREQEAAPGLEQPEGFPLLSSVPGFSCSGKPSAGPRRVAGGGSAPSLGAAGEQANPSTQTKDIWIYKIMGSRCAVALGKCHSTSHWII
ncbi:uncharacterized protein LOC125439614 [Sphaerodactylus townsendi]|uniref:uncharacterized protein LOC125439614 n=1 Tax=Sphaerodactylus townsendi TaxID=933632 RepID=UPI0020273259|nr:uncharacterized protein LOC125439614 [Sphaerodactylus townsendi]